VATGKYPGYKRVAINQVPVRHTNGAVWKFHWIHGANVQYTADDIFYRDASTSAGAQDYALYFRSPSSNFDNKTIPMMQQILPTFQIVTS
jgi:hypothetical protein